jgi:hypothetical protein
VRAALYPTWTSAAIQVLLESRHSSKNNHLCIRGSRFGLSKVKTLCPTISQGGAKRDVVVSGFRYFPKSSDVEGKVGPHGCNMKYLERAMQSLRTLGYQLITKHWPTSYEIRDIIYMLIPLEACQENYRPLLGDIYTLHGPLSKIQVPRKVMPMLTLLEARSLKHTLKPSLVLFFCASRLLFLEYYPVNESGNEI